MKNLVECVEMNIYDVNIGGLTTVIKNKLKPIIEKYNNDGYKVVSTELLNKAVSPHASSVEACLVIIFEKIED